MFKPKEKSIVHFLGLTHYWKRGRRGSWDIARKTIKSRFARGVKAINRWCRFNRHQPLQAQYVMLSQKMTGHYAYYGVSGNMQSLKRFRYAVECNWVKWLKRRSQRHRLNNMGIEKLRNRYCLPVAKIRTTGPAKVMF